MNTYFGDNLEIKFQCRVNWKIFPPFFPAILAFLAGKVVVIYKLFFLYFQRVTLTGIRAMGKPRAPRWRPRTTPRRIADPSSSPPTPNRRIPTRYPGFSSLQGAPPSHLRFYSNSRLQMRGWRLAWVSTHYFPLRFFSLTFFLTFCTCSQRSFTPFFLARISLFSFFLH